MACKLNLCALRSSRSYPETTSVQSMLCALIWGFLIQSGCSIIMLSLELALLSWDNTYLACTLRSHLGFAHSICALYRRALFETSAIILRQYPFSLCFALSSRVCSFNQRILSSCSLWSIRIEISCAKYNYLKWQYSLFPVPQSSKGTLEPLNFYK